MKYLQNALVAIAEGITLIFGWLGWLVIIYGTVIFLDYITGTAVAIKEKNWSSSFARDGLWKKTGSIIAVLVAGLTDLVLNLILNNMPTFNLPFYYSVLLCPIVLIWYIVTEIGSIIENAARMGAPIPKFLKNFLAILQKTVETQSLSEKQDNFKNNATEQKRKKPRQK